MIDFHCHLDLYPNPDAVAASAQQEKVAVLSVTTTPSAFRGTAALAAERPMVRTALGLHPELAHQRRHELALFDELVATTPFVGEIGLDGSSRFAQMRTSQSQAFTHILRSCSDAGGRILSIHSRGAVRPVLDALRANPDSGVPVLHWFTGTARQAETAIEQGCWFSIGTPILTTAKGRALVIALPRDRILTETDGPFATHNDQALVPRDVSHTLRLLAASWAVDTSHAEGQIAANMEALLAAHAGEAPRVIPRPQRSDPR
ncbi:Qat anti-phage system TatD family nuclease QatD [Microlunatus sp. Gsoil 973]|uniref:Qat anti-phage system TatD family nuclease QatD n=1 Tax=Microlunatus sp. Gsoil 973 TaxID=2672569 RepID=UPI0012B452B5|nr:TatD family deoxyribonuclease [Microlunatus sp. Gsoil 973]